MAGLIVTILIASVIALWWFFVRNQGRKTSDWDSLLRKFPTGAIHRTGARFKRCTGFFGDGRNGQVYEAFTLECAHEGLLITANFAKKTPILIPWPSVRDVETIDPVFTKTVVILSVDYEPRIRFHVPASALASLQQNLSADNFNKPQNLFDEIKNRINDRLP